MYKRQAGDLLLFAADKKKLVYDVLGALRLELAKQMDLLDKNEYRFVWVTEFPDVYKRQHYSVVLLEERIFLAAVPVKSGRAFISC